MTTFVLVHGSWHGAWCWQRLVPLLEARGHKTVAPDLPGMGADVTAIDKVSLAGWAEFVANQARKAAEPVVLVGHSRGGVVISQAAEVAPDRVLGLVYLTAILLPDGGQVVDLLEHMNPEGLAAMRPAEDGLSSTLDPAAARRLMYNTTAPDWADRAVASLRRDPSVPNITPLRLSPARYGARPRAYIECLQDRTLPIALQRRMQSAMPSAPVLSLDTDHSPFFSAPEALSVALTTVARRFEAA